MTRLGTLPLLLACLLAPAPAAALSIAFVPQDQTVGVGATVDVDVVVSGLHAETPDEIVSAFDLLVGYDPLVLSATGVTFGSELGDPLTEALTFADVTTDPSLVQLLEISFLADAVLDAAQGDAVTLATLHFSADASGTSPLSFVLDALHGVDGLAAQRLTLVAGTGSVTVVPEPSTLALVLLSGVVLLRLRRAPERR